MRGSHLSTATVEWRETYRRTLSNILQAELSISVTEAFITNIYIFFLDIFLLFCTTISCWDFREGSNFNIFYFLVIHCSD